MKISLWQIEEVLREHSKVGSGYVLYIPEELFHSAALKIKKISDDLEEKTRQEALLFKE